MTIDEMPPSEPGLLSRSPEFHWRQLDDLVAGSPHDWGSVADLDTVGLRQIELRLMDWNP